MSELEHEIREGLDRLSRSTGKSDPITLGRLVAKRRKRRIQKAVLTSLPIVIVLGLFGFVTRSGDEIIVSGDGNQESSSLPVAVQTVSVERTEVVGRGGGTASVVMEFDGPLPGRNIEYVDDITSIAAEDVLVYSTQPAGNVQVCESVHSFPPPAVGTVDVLIPAKWFAAGDETYTSELETIANPAKFVVCGPKNGFYQYSIWGAVSADPADVNITIDPDGTRLTIQIDSPSLESINGPATRGESCQPATFDTDPSGGLPDVEARTDRGDRAWALFFNPEPLTPGEPVTVKINTELKIVWQATGEGDPGFVAIGPDMTETIPTSGPNVHAGSNWQRVLDGDGWDTGWSFPHEGCWRFELSRDGTLLATLDIAVVP